MRFVFDGFELDDATFRLTSSGDVVAIEPQVFDVLVYLVNHRDRVVPKEELLDSIWGDRFVSESALTSRIKSARRAVGDDGRAQRLISTVHGRGYQFVGQVAQVDPNDDTSEPLDSTTGSSSVDDHTPNAGQPSSTMPPITAAERAERLALAVDEEFPFVGRRDVLQTARSLEDIVTAGRTAVLLVGGEPGIGKTRLATEVARRAAGRRLLPLGGRCDRYLATSLQPWLEALAIYVDTTGQQQLRSDLAGIDQHLRAVAPSLDARLGPVDGERAEAAVRSPDEYAIIDALAVLMERAGRRQPMVVVLDDVQWAGGATRALTSLLLRRGTAPVFLVLTFRTTIDDLDQAARDWLNELSGHASVARVDLAGLSPADVAEMVESAVGDGSAGGTDGPTRGAPVDADVGTQVFAMSAGHALFATELLRDLRGGVGIDRLPSSVTELVRVRLDGLPRDVNRLVSTAAAIGQEFALAPVIAATELSNADALDAIDVALGAELVHEVEGTADRFRFSHQLMPAAVLDSMSSARRIRLHARLAEVMEQHGASTMAVAHHLIEACPILDAAEVVNRVRRTAAAAIAEFDYDSAAGLLARCVELPMDTRRRAEIYAELGAAYNAAGRQPQALEPFDRTAQLARSNGWPDLLIAAALGRWGVSPFRASRDRTVVPLLDEALALATGDDGESTPSPVADDVTVARLLAKKAAFMLFSAELAERDALSARAVELVGDEITHERLEVVEARWMAIACPARWPAITVLDEELAVLRKELGALTSDACAPEIGMYGRAEGEELRRLAAEIADDPRYRRDVDQWRMSALGSTFALFAGDLDEARRLADKALPLGREPWGESGQIVHGFVHLMIDAINGEAERSLARWRRIAASVPSDSMRANWGWAEALAGDRDTAAGIIESVVPHFTRMAENFMGGHGLVAAAETIITLEREDLAAPLLDVLGPLDDIMFGHPWAPGRAIPDIGCVLSLMLGDEDGAREFLDRAMVVYAGLDAPLLADILRSRAASIAG
ncbi:MAG: AAA family ATPase [Acidimicrobiia bacterium]|nr:AAA family ATPase [Acidimicrobiia bacterium]